MRSIIRQIGLFWIARFGSPIRDEASGELLGRALILVWRGRVHLIGYEGEPLRVGFVPQDKVRYWRQSVGFSRVQEPDFPKEPRG